MKTIISLVILALLFCAVFADYECTMTSYRQYLQSQNRRAGLSDDQLKPYFDRFCQSLKFVTQNNAKCNCQQLGINRFSDQIDSERQQLLNAKRPVTPSSAKVQMGNKKVQNGLLSVGTAPPNWQAKNKISKIKDQGSCGSCWAFTGAGLYESYLMVKGKQELDLSEEFLLECTSVLISNGYVSSCNGGFTDFSVQVAQKYGLPLESAWPYKGATFGSVASTPVSPGICELNQTFNKYDNMPGVKNTTFYKRYDNVTVAEMQVLLAEGPVGALMYVGAEFQAYKSNVFTLCPASFDVSFRDINHAVVIVGMDANKNYIIKNSWGTTWGESGFATVSSTNDCALSAYVYALTWGDKLVGTGLMLIMGLIFLML